MAQGDREGSRRVAGCGAACKIASGSRSLKNVVDGVWWLHLWLYPVWHPMRHPVWHPMRHPVWHPVRHPVWHPVLHPDGFPPCIDNTTAFRGELPKSFKCRKAFQISLRERSGIPFFAKMAILVSRKRNFMRLFSIVRKYCWLGNG